jgi:hypothetical protein
MLGGCITGIESNYVQATLPTRFMSSNAASTGGTGSWWEEQVSLW